MMKLLLVSIFCWRFTDYVGNSPIRFLELTLELPYISVQPDPCGNVIGDLCPPCRYQMLHTNYNFLSSHNFGHKTHYSLNISNLFENV